jgi:predicted dehydrogenase
MVLNRGMEVIQRTGKSACAAGKHVYVEKPCSHKHWERERSMKREAKHDDRAQTIGFQPGSYSRFQ